MFIVQRCVRSRVWARDQVGLKLTLCIGDAYLYRPTMHAQVSHCQKSYGVCLHDHCVPNTCIVCCLQLYRCSTEVWLFCVWECIIFSSTTSSSMPAAVKSADGKHTSKEKGVGLFWVQHHAVLCSGGRGLCWKHLILWELSDHWPTLCWLHLSWGDKSVVWSFTHSLLTAFVLRRRECCLIIHPLLVDYICPEETLCGRQEIRIQELTNQQY